MRPMTTRLPDTAPAAVPGIDTPFTIPVGHLMYDVWVADDFDAVVMAMLAELPDGWLGYFLGGNVHHVEAAPLSPACMRFRGSYGAHAYALSAAGLRRAYDHVSWRTADPIDVALLPWPGTTSGSGSTARPGPSPTSAAGTATSRTA